MEGPVGAFSRPIRLSGNLDEAVVEGEIVTEGVLPSLGVLAVVRKSVGDELVDL